MAADGRAGAQLGHRRALPGGLGFGAACAARAPGRAGLRWLGGVRAVGAALRWAPARPSPSLPGVEGT